jgi:hypothetical protein
VKQYLFLAAAAAIIAVPVLVLAFAPAPDAGSRPVEYKACNGYAESRDSALKGDASFLAVTSMAEFSRLFAPVLTPRGAPDPVAKDAFDTRLFVAVIKRGDALWDYKVEKVTANGDTLTVRYTATPRKGGAVTHGETMRKPVGISTSKGETIRVRATEKADPRPARGETRKADAPKATARATRTTEVAVRATVKGYGTGKASKATERVRDASATFDSPLILSVPKDKYLTVVFVENGHKVGSARVGN